jgi:hypothetical protein
MIIFLKKSSQKTARLAQLVVGGQFMIITT